MLPMDGAARSRHVMMLFEMGHHTLIYSFLHSYHKLTGALRMGHIKPVVMACVLFSP